MPDLRQVCRFLFASLVLCVALLAAGSAQATPTLIGESVTVTFSEAGFPDEQDTVVVSSAAEIMAGDPTNIGSNIFISGSGEQIDIQDFAVRFTLFGGGPNEVQTGFRDLGFDASARFELTNLFDPLEARITGVTVNLLDVVLVGGGEVLFSDHSLTLIVGTLGVFEDADNLGFVNIGLQIQDLTPTNPVPEPGTLGLLVTAGVAAAVRQRRRMRTFFTTEGGRRS